MYMYVYTIVYMYVKERLHTTGKRDAFLVFEVEKQYMCHMHLHTNTQLLPSGPPQGNTSLTDPVVSRETFLERLRKHRQPLLHARLYHSNL